MAFNRGRGRGSGKGQGPPELDAQGNPIYRVRLPREAEGEILGIVEEMVGGARMRVNCADGIMRLCRVPGKMKRFAWVRAGDLVIIKAWEYDKAKGDIEFRYHKGDAEYLRTKGYLKGL